MQGLPDSDLDFFFKQLLIPLTTAKAITWIVIIGFIVYVNMLFNGFIWDDWGLIINNPTTHSFGNCFNFFFNLGVNQNLTFYRPITMCGYSLIYSLFGANSFYYHFFQLALHISNTCLLFILFCRFFKKQLSFILGLIFLVNPINTEAVNYISTIPDSLYFFFGILAFIVLDKHILNFRQLLVGSFLMLCSLFSKESAVLFFVIIIFYKVLNGSKKNIKLISTLLTVTGIYIIARLSFANSHGYSNLYVPIAQVPLYIRLQTIPKVFLFYIKTFFYPDHLAIAQYWVVRSLSLNEFVLPLLFDSLFLLMIIFLGMYIWRYKRNNFKIYEFFCVWLLAGIGLHLQIIPLDQTVAEHYFYFGSVGILGLLGVILSNYNYNRVKTNTLLTVFFVMIIIILSIRTIVRNSNWVNMLTLYSHDISYSDSSGVLAFNLGMQLFDMENYTEAGKYLNESVEYAPDDWINWNSLGVYNLYMKNYALAENDFRLSIKYNVNYIPAYENYASALANHGDQDTAKNFIVKSLNKFPQDGELWSSLALVYYRTGSRQNAILAAKQAYTFEPTQQNELLYSHLSENLPLIIDTNTVKVNKY